MRGSVSAERRDRCHRHLQTCEACRTRLAERQPEADDSAKAVAGSPVAVEETADRHPEDGFAPGIRLGDFRIEERLGAGGMGVVYRVRQLSLNRQVALKVIRPGLGMTDTPSAIGAGDWPRKKSVANGAAAASSSWMWTRAANWSA